jgi:hypothetical protein
LANVEHDSAEREVLEQAIEQPYDRLASLAIDRWLARAFQDEAG